MTDAEIAKMLKDQFAQSRKMLDIREKYYNEFSKILSQKQIMKIYQQEKSNMNKFRKEFDRRKGQKPGQGHKPGQDRQRQRQHTPHQTQKQIMDQVLFIIVFYFTKVNTNWAQADISILFSIVDYSLCLVTDKFWQPMHSPAKRALPDVQLMLTHDTWYSASESAGRIKLIKYLSV